MHKRASKKGAVFWLCLFAVIAAISATVLLANDKRNLRLLLLRFDIHLQPATMTIPKPGTHLQPKRNLRALEAPLKGKAIVLEPHILAPEVKNYSSMLVRRVFHSGKTICASFKANGFAISEWRKSPFDAKLYECSVEQFFPNKENPDEPASFFLMIKATPSGAFTQARMKITFTTLEGRQQSVAMALKAARIFGQATGWRDLIKESGRIERLEPFASSRFGVNIKFSSEFGGPGRYNLAINMATPADKASKVNQFKRTADYFNRDSHMPLLPEIAIGGDRPQKK